MKKLIIVILILFGQFLQFSANAQPVMTVLTDSSSSKGYTFLASYGTPMSNTWFLLILNNHGKPIFSKSFPTSMNGNFTDFKPQPNNKYSFFASKQSCYYIMDKFFNIIDTIVAKNGFATDNHELVVTQNNHYFLIAQETRTINMSLLVAGGKTNARVMGTIIQELDASKNVVFQWKALDHIPVTDCMGQDLTASNIDYIHTNSLFLDSDTTLIMSHRHLNELTKISLNTGNIIWRMGSNSNGNQFTFVNDPIGFSYQHYARRLPNGNITLFDNGNQRSSSNLFSRACEYKIDEVTKVATLVWQFRNNPDVFGASMGSTQRLANGNTLINWGSTHPNITEVDSTGKKVFELTLPYIYTYRALKYDIDDPTLPFTSSVLNICDGKTAPYSTVYYSSRTYLWKVTNGIVVSGQGTNAVNVKWLTPGMGMVKVITTSTAGYIDSNLVNVTVLQSPKAKMSVTPICNGAQFIDSTTNLASRMWHFGDGDTSTLADITHIYTAPGTYHVKLKVFNSFGCADSILDSIIISKSPKVDFSIDAKSCVAQTVSVINNSTDVSTYLWDLGDSQTSALRTPVAFAYKASGTYNVKLFVTGAGCKDSLTKSVVVNSNPTAKMNLTAICSGERFIDSNINSANCIWDFGDGDTSTLTDIRHIYAAPGIYNVKLKVFNSQGCADSIILPVIINKAPKADFSIDSKACVGEPISVINNSTDFSNNFWDLGDSVSSNLITPSAFSYNSAGSYHVKLVVYGADCKDSLTKIVVVSPNPKAKMSVTEICNGARFIDSTINSANRVWDFGDGDSSSTVDITHIYATPGTYNVKLKVFNSDGCADSIIQSVTINKAPKADFSMDAKSCVGETISFINNSTDASAYFWDFGNSQSSNLGTPLAFSYNSAGSYNVKLIVSIVGCEDSLTKTVIVNANPKAMISVTEICNGAKFIDSTTNLSYRVWDFGDGNSSSIANITHIYTSPGTYNVKLKVFNSDGCADSIIQSVKINKAPKADFSLDAKVCALEPISIINNSTDGSSYFWDFGNSQTSNLITPSVFSYNTAAVYNVKLIASTTVCKDSLTKSVIVNQNPVAKFGSNQQSNATMQFKDSSSISAGNITFWNWNFGDGDSSIIQNPIHIFAAPNTYSVRLCVNSDEGCENCISKSIVVSATSIDQSVFENSISIYPNPGNGKFSIKSAKQLDLISVLNTFGQEVLVVNPKNSIEIIDLTNEPQGVYFVKVSSQNRNKVVRIIKN